MVTAYRRIPFDNNRNKCNIDFANDIFNHIRQSVDENPVVIAFDIKGFFDNLKHKKLKQAWLKTLGLTPNSQLPKDHYNVFKSITKFSYVEEKDLFSHFQNKIWIKNNSGRFRQNEIKRIEYLFNQNAIAYCHKDDIQEVRKNGLIYSNKKDENGNLRDYGICQGSPISATLANMYMLDFDIFIKNEINKINGLYRRYSDDMVVVCSTQHKQHVIALFQNAINKMAELTIEPSKTQIFHFNYDNKDGRLYCFQEFANGLNQNSKNRNFEYLGFSFDGKYTYLKTATLAKYHRKVRNGVRRCAYYRDRIDNQTRGQIFRRRLYKRYSHIGAKRSIKYRRKVGTTNQWEKTKIYNWGNFITYAYLASQTLDDNKVKSQVKNHWKFLQNDIKKTIRNDI